MAKPMLIHQMKNLSMIPTSAKQILGNATNSIRATPSQCKVGPLKVIKSILLSPKNDITEKTSNRAPSTGGKSGGKVFYPVQWRKVVGTLTLTNEAIVFSPHIDSEKVTKKTTKKLTWNRVQSFQVRILGSPDESNQQKFQLRVKFQKTKARSALFVLRVGDCEALHDINEQTKKFLKSSGRSCRIKSIGFGKHIDFPMVADSSQKNNPSQSMPQAVSPQLIRWSRN